MLACSRDSSLGTEGEVMKVKEPYPCNACGKSVDHVPEDARLWPKRGYCYECDCMSTILVLFEQLEIPEALPPKQAHPDEEGDS